MKIDIALHKQVLTVRYAQWTGSPFSRELGPTPMFSQSYSSDDINIRLLDDESYVC